MHYSEEPPTEAYVAVRKGSYWFYIDDRDAASKRTFSFLQVLLSLAETGEHARGPVVSIGN